MERRQAGQHFLITGAGTGIGQAVALRLAAEGAALSLLAREVQRLEETAAAASDAGASGVAVVPADITDEFSVSDAFDSAVMAHGPLRGIVANAGIGGPNFPGPEDRFFALVQTNLIGTYYCLRAAQERLLPGPEPRHMLVTASILARFGVPGYTGYCASKTGLLGLVRALAHELAPQNVQVNALCPGWVNTAMARAGIQAMADGMGITYDQAHAQAMTAVPFGRMSEPADVAGAAAWLLSPDARGVTGQGIDINNGAWMG